MQKYDIHVCIISNEAAANLLPVGIPEFKPNEAIFLITEDMKGKAESLKKSFQSLGIAVYEFNISDPYDFETIENEILDILSSYKGGSFSELNIALNATGGTKPMAMAAQSIFSLAKKDIFYVNTTKKSVIFLSGNKKNNFSLNSNLSLSHYFNSYGFTIKEALKRNNPIITNLFYDFFIKDYSKNKGSISIINSFSANAKINNYVFNNKDAGFYSLKNFLYQLHENRFIKFNEEKIDFLNDENRKFVGGSWLEHYVFQKIKEIPQVNDLSLSVRFIDPTFDNAKKDIDKINLGKQNEFDLAFIANNKLHIIECKTIKFNEKGEEEDEKDIIYKIEALRNKMGEQAKGCLISYLPVSIALRNRASNYDIMIIEGNQIQNVKNLVQQWIEN